MHYKIKNVSFLLIKRVAVLCRNEVIRILSKVKMVKIAETSLREGKNWQNKFSVTY